MIDDRRLQKPANEKNKQKYTENFPQCLHTTTLILLHKIKKNQFQKNVQMMETLSSERENKNDNF